MKSFNRLKTATLATAMLAALVGPCLATDLVVIVNPAAGTLTKDQVSDLFLGKSQALTPLDLPESSPVRALFYPKATRRDLPQVKATWSRIVFTGKGQVPRELADAAAIKKAVSADPKAIGYIERSSLDSTVKVAWSVE